MLLFCCCQSLMRVHSRGDSGREITGMLVVSLRDARHGFWTIPLIGTNFRGHLISRKKGRHISRVFIFAIWAQNYFFRELIFAKMKKQNKTKTKTKTKTKNKKQKHLPRKMSRATRFFLLRGGVVCAKVIGKNHRRSPLVQGGLEIPVQVTAEMDLTERNKTILEKYKQIVVSNYKEPGIDGISMTVQKRC